MSAVQKLIAAIFIALVWLASIILKHFFADLDTATFNVACYTALVGLGAFHAGAASNGEPGQFVTGTLQTFAPAPAAAAPAAGQTGFATVRIMVIVASIALGLSMLGGCASLTNAGHAAYTVDMGPAGCKVTVADGKEYKSRSVVLNCDKGQFAVTEEDSKAFKGQALAVKGLTILPSMGLQDILAPK